MENIYRIVNVKDIDNNNCNSQNVFPILLLNGLVMVTNKGLLACKL